MLFGEFTNGCYKFDQLVHFILCQEDNYSDAHIVITFKMFGSQCSFPNENRLYITGFSFNVGNY